jgi:hypothetical protein
MNIYEIYRSIKIYIYICMYVCVCVYIYIYIKIDIYIYLFKLYYIIEHTLLYNQSMKSSGGRSKLFGSFISYMKMSYRNALRIDWL